MHPIVTRLLTAAALLLCCAPASAQTCSGTYPGSCVKTDDGVDKEVPVLGENGSTGGGFKLMGAGTGYVLVQPATGAITSYNFTLPSSAGTAGYLLTSAAGSGPLTWTSPTVQVNGVNCTLASSCTISASAGTITIGVTTIASGTSGYMLYNNGGLLGNLGTTGSAGNVVLSSSPSISGLTVTGSFTATGLVTTADLATEAANTVLGNATSGAASPSALSIGSCSTASSALQWTTNSGFGCNTSITANAAPAANLTGTTLASGVTASSLTSFGSTPAIASPVLSGTATGNYTLGGTPSISGAAINSGTVSGSYLAATNLAGTGNGGVTGVTGLANGGTNASLTASNGGVVWSNASQLQILAGAGPSGKMLQSGAYASPAWSAATWPSDVSQGQFLYASGTSAWTASFSPTLGLNGSVTGALNLATNASGGASIALENGGATTGYNFNLPVTAGTSSYLLTSGGGAAAAMTWTSPTVTVNSVPCTLGSSCSIVASTGLVVGSSTVGSGTSGYILYDNAGTLGNLPVTGTAGNVVLSNAPSIAGATITGSFNASGLVTNTDLANMTAYSVKCNATSGSASPTDCTTLPSGLTAPNFVIASPSGAAALILNDVAGSQQSGITLEDAGTVKWQLVKQTDNSFLINDAVNSKIALNISTGGNVTLGEGSNQILLPASGAITLGTTNGLTVTPTSGTTNNGIHITQTGPNTGSQAGFAYYNNIDVVDGVNNHAGNNYSGSLQISYTMKSNANGQKTVISSNSFHDEATANAGDQIGSVEYVESTASNGGTVGTPAGTMYGNNPIVHLFSGATYYRVAGAEEADVGVETGAQVQTRFGFSAAAFAPVQGSVTDAAFIATASAGPWQNALYLSNAYIGGTGAPVSSTGCIICDDGASATIGKGIDIHYTISGNFLHTPDFVQSGKALGFYAGQSSTLAVNAVPGMAAHYGSSVAANAQLGLSIDTGSMILYRDITDGGSALVFCEAGYGPQIIAQSSTNFATTDPGSGGNKWWITNAASHYCDVENRYSVSKSITYILLSTSGGTYQ